ncbi:cysteine hydrolase [Pueribacillus theae]|uniref:Cysteine hydrolase n=1 Tax=Pueribacillus theae TaxID=2171751 RepID=A0A2U1JVB1_9BACI|nr:isochorismatase family cysteine hydrolase [Pueribacillus theae]PWA08874.1 cysteine hydrolase [Pueribacillus theae]
MSIYTKPHWKQSILITIDTQNDFTLPNAPAEIKGTIDVIPNMIKLLRLYREKGLPILHVIRLYKEDGSNADSCRKEAIENGSKIAVPYTEGAELVASIRPSPYSTLDAKILLQNDFQSIGKNEWIMYKPRWGAFYKTKLEEFLNDQNIDTLIFTGCNFPNCPRTSIYEASERDFRVVMVSNAMSQVYDKGIQEMKNIGVNVCLADEVKEALQSIK